MAALLLRVVGYVPLVRGLCGVMKLLACLADPVHYFLLARFEHMKKLYVGNISFQTDEETLRQVFSQYGAVDQVDLVRDRDSGQPRGFGFVSMTNDNEADTAINALNGQMLEGRALTVNEARPKTDRGFGGGGGGRGGYGGGRGGGGGGGGGRGRGGY